MGLCFQTVQRFALLGLGFCFLKLLNVFFFTVQQSFFFFQTYFFFLRPCNYVFLQKVAIFCVVKPCNVLFFFKTVQCLLFCKRLQSSVV